MSKLRPELATSSGKDPCPKNGTALYLIYNAVRARRGLIHGALKLGGEYCAIGSFFADHKGSALEQSLIDEVALVNDSLPTGTKFQRRQVVLKWLRWKLKALNFPIR